MSPRRRLLLAVGAAVVLLGGCAFYRADQCRGAQAELRIARTDYGSALHVRAAGDVARWCWPLG